MLTPTQLASLSLDIEANADRLIATHQKKRPPHANPIRKRSPTERRGRPAKKISNRFVGHVGPSTEYDRYPDFAMDVVEGVARLDWHNRKENSTDTSKPLSVRLLMNLLAFVDEISTSSVADYSGLSPRHAQRYVKAIGLMMPHLLASRPERLIEAMDSDDSQKLCPIYLRRIHIGKTYWALAGDKPMNRSAYYSLNQCGPDGHDAGHGWSHCPEEPVN